MDMKERWVGKEWSDEEEELIDYIDSDENDELFKDMLFDRSPITEDFVMVEATADRGANWFVEVALRPDELAYFSYNFFDFYVRELPEGSAGRFNPETQSLTISPEYVHNEPTILHELIHLHEYVLNSLPVYYHDLYFYCMYKYLRDKIPDLDDQIYPYAHLLCQQMFHNKGGSHDLLFLLKSFDLDLKKGYKLGTIFGYKPL